MSCKHVIKTKCVEFVGGKAIKLEQPVLEMFNDDDNYYVQEFRSWDEVNQFIDYLKGVTRMTFGDEHKVSAGLFKPEYKDLSDPKVVEEVTALGCMTQEICNQNPGILKIVWKDGTVTWSDGSSIPNSCDFDGTSEFIHQSQELTQIKLLDVDPTLVTYKGKKPLKIYKYSVGNIIRFELEFEDLSLIHI